MSVKKSKVKQKEILEDPVEHFVKTRGIGIAIVIIVAILFVLSVYSIPGGSVGVKFNRMGEVGFSETELPEGFGLRMPIAQSIHKISYRTQTISFCNPEEGKNKECGYNALTPKDKNGIDFNVDITVRYKLDQTQAAEFIEQKGFGVDAMEKIIMTAARADSTRGVFGKYAQEDVPDNRIEISNIIIQVLQDRINQEASGRLKSGFLTIEAIDVRNTQFNPKIEARIIQKQEKLQEAQEMEYKLITANKTREKVIIEADAIKQSTILKAEGEAEAVLVLATAKAKGIQKVNDAYQNMPKEYIDSKYAEAMKELAGSGATVVVDMNRFASGSNVLPIVDVNNLMGGLKSQKKLSTE